MKSWLTLIIVATGCCSMTACSSMSDACKGISAGGGTKVPLVGTAIGLTCASNGAALIGSDIARRTGGDDPATPPPKSFQSSKLVMKDLSDNAEVMQFVIDSQDKYRAGDYGLATDDQKKAAVGRYVSATLGKTLLIRDSSKAWYVSYESEPEPAT